MESDGLSMVNLDLASEPPPLAATVMSTSPPGIISTETTEGVLSPVFLRVEGGVGEDAGAELVVWVVVGAADALIDHLLDGHQGLAVVVPTGLHAELDEGRYDAGVLADGAVAFGAHAGVDEDLGHGVFGRRGLFELIGSGEVGDEVLRMVVGDVLEGVGDGLDEVGLFDGGHVDKSL